MQAKFFAVGSFFIRSRNMFVAVGDIIEGHIEPGMAVAVSLGSISVSTKVKEVEVIGVDFRDKEYMVGLIRSRRQFLYAANASRSVLSYSPGLT